MTNDQSPITNDQWSNPNASSNMTMIARLADPSTPSNPITPSTPTIRVFIGSTLVGVATPGASPRRNGESGLRLEGLYFLTIQSDLSGPLRFETEDGTVLAPLSTASINSASINSEAINAEGNKRDAVTINYVPDAHYGSLSAPVVLMPAEADDNRTYKLIEDNHVVIIRNGERYDITGKKLE